MQWKDWRVFLYQLFMSSNAEQKRTCWRWKLSRFVIFLFSSRKGQQKCKSTSDQRHPILTFDPVLGQEMCSDLKRWPAVGRLGTAGINEIHLPRDGWKICGWRTSENTYTKFDSSCFERWQLRLMILTNIVKEKAMQGAWRQRVCVCVDEFSHQPSGVREGSVLNPW